MALLRSFCLRFISSSSLAWVSIVEQVRFPSFISLFIVSGPASPAGPIPVCRTCLSFASLLRTGSGTAGVFAFFDPSPARKLFKRNRLLRAREMMVLVLHAGIAPTALSWMMTFLPAFQAFRRRDQALLQYGVYSWM